MVLRILLLLFSAESNGQGPPGQDHQILILSSSNSGAVLLLHYRLSGLFTHFKIRPFLTRFLQNVSTLRLLYY